MGVSVKLTLGGKIGGLPGGESTGEFSEIIQCVLLEDRGGDGRAIAAGALHDDATIAGELIHAFLQMIQRKIQAAVDARRGVQRQPALCALE